MSVPDRATPTSSALPTPTVPTRVRAIAARLAALFETDQEIVARLNGAHRLFAASNDRLRCDPAAGPLVAHEQVDRAFCAYQQASEQRRQLAVAVGELSQQLTDALTAAGYHPEHARSANVHQLAAGTWQATDEGTQSER
jgi:hypothetical protein